MSIIYDALKKVEGKIENEQPKKYAFPVKFIVYLGIIIVGILIASLFFNFLPGFFQKDTNLPSEQLSGAATPQAPIAAPPAPSMPAQPKPQEAQKQPMQQEKNGLPALTLNGVFFADDTTFALINNRIVKEGDDIEGLTVQKIDKQEILLKNGETTVRIPISTTW